MYCWAKNQNAACRKWFKQCKEQGREAEEEEEEEESTTQRSSTNDYAEYHEETDGHRGALAGAAEQP